MVKAIEHQYQWLVCGLWHLEDDDGPLQDRVALVLSLLVAASAP